MGKAVVTIKIPALGLTSDFGIPDTMLVQDVQQLIIKILSSEYGISDSGQEVTLMDMNDGLALPQDTSFNQLGISDGARLLLI